MVWRLAASMSRRVVESASGSNQRWRWYGNLQSSSGSPRRNHRRCKGQPQSGAFWKRTMTTIFRGKCRYLEKTKRRGPGLPADARSVEFACRPGRFRHVPAENAKPRNAMTIFRP